MSSFSQEHISWNTLNFPQFETLVISVKELSVVCEKLQLNKAKGNDMLPPILFRKLKDHLAHSLHQLFSKALQTCVYPSEWKKSSCYTTIQRGSKQIVASYRPVSLLTIPSKLFEKLLFRRLFLHLKPFLHHSQYGFRPRRSTVTQLLVLLDKIYSALENDYEINVVFTDFSKAFDKVDQGILLQKLSKYGIGGKLLKLIHNYLNGRTQTVRVNSSYSSEFVVRSGVSQGSLLGPLFLLVYINDIAKSDSLIPLLFADDSKFLGLDISSMAFQDDLDRLYE